jgi:DNA-directed RNA polymerase
MRKSIALALESDRGLSFAMIHDSFGCHASDMKWFLAECIKPAFVDMYQGGDNLELFKKEIAVGIDKDHMEKLRPLPAKGSLVLEEVLESEFFFS